MPDARQPGPTAPDDWSQAFAALPLETPPAGGWNRLAATLPARRDRSRIWIPAAAAACLALAIAVPWRGTAPDQSPPIAATTPPAVTPSVAPPTASPSPPSRQADPTPLAASDAASLPNKADADVVDDRKPATNAAPPDGSSSLDTGLATAPVRAPKDRDAGVRPQPPSAGADADAADRRQAASTAVAAHTGAPAEHAAGSSPPPASPEALETLYAESAQLEALLAQIRDDRVASGPAMALSAALNERVAGIDVALSQPDLETDTRVRLWRERVEVLQRLTGVESTQRWMAANGYQADGAVAQVY